MEKYLIILVILAIIYFILNKLKDTDGFEDSETKEKPKIPVQNMAGIDDTNAINTLAQISKQLMAGGLTVPGDMAIKGNVDIKGSVDITGASHSITATKNLNLTSVDVNIKGLLTVNGRNILAELDKLNSRWKDDNLIVAGHLTVNNGSNFSGGRHFFKDSENGGRLRVGGVYGKPGIWGEDTAGLVQVVNFEVGSQRAADPHTHGMQGDKWYDFIRSKNPSYAILGPTNTGQFGMAWENGEMYWTFLEKNKRFNGDYGHLPN